MTIGSLLLQPQPLSRFDQMSYEQALGDDAIVLLQKLATNPELLEMLAAQVGHEMEDLVAELQQHIEARMQA